MSNLSTTPATEAPANRPYLSYTVNDRTRVLVLIAIAVVAIAMVAVVSEALIIRLRSPTLPQTVTISGSINMNHTVTPYSITMWDSTNPQGAVSSPLTGFYYSITVPNQHVYNIEVVYHYPTNICYTNQAGNYVCTTIWQGCFKGPLNVHAQTKTMNYNIDCTTNTP